MLDWPSAWPQRPLVDKPSEPLLRQRFGKFSRPSSMSIPDCPGVAVGHARARAPPSPQAKRGSPLASKSKTVS